MNRPKRRQVLCVTIFLLLAVVACKKEQPIYDLKTIIPQDSLFYLKIDHFYQYQQRAKAAPVIDLLLADADQIIDILLQKEAKKETAHTARSLKALKSQLPPFGLKDVLKQQIVLGLGVNGNTVEPYIIMAFEEDAAPRFDHFFDVITQWLDGQPLKKRKLKLAGQNVVCYRLPSGAKVSKNSPLGAAKADDRDVCLCRMDQKIFISLSQSRMTSLLELVKNPEAKQAIASNPVYAQLKQKGLFYDAAPLEGFYDNAGTTEVIVHLLDMLPAEKQEHLGQWTDFITSTLRTVKGFCFSYSDGSKAFESNSYLLFAPSAKDNALTSLLIEEPSEIKCLHYLPENTLQAYAFNCFTPLQLYEYLIGPSPLPDTVKQQIQQAVETDVQPGLNPKRDFLQHLGKEIGYGTLQYGSMGFLGMEAVLLLEHVDKEKTRATVNKLVGMVEGLNQKVSPYRETYKDYEMVVFPVGLASPTILVSDDFIILGFTRVTMKKIIDTMEGDTSSLAKTKIIKDSLQELQLPKRSNAVYIMSFSDYIKSLSAMLNTLPMFMKHMDKIDPETKQIVDIITRDLPRLFDNLDLYSYVISNSYYDGAGYLSRTITLPKED